VSSLGTSAALGTAAASRSRLRRHWYLVPFAIFAVTRIIDAIMLIVMARHQVPDPVVQVSPLGPYGVAQPSYLEVIANWDGQWYREIATHGYPGELPMVDGKVEQNVWAYYPLYPGLIRIVMAAHVSFGVAASIVSLTCAAAAMCLLFRMLDRTAGRFAATMGVVAMCSFPAAVSFQLAYTEGLALLLLLSALWCLREGRYFGLMAATVALSLTRPIVLPLTLVLAVTWLVRWRSTRSEFLTGDRFRLALATGISIASFGLWPVIAWLGTGDPSAFGVSQQAWILDGSTGWPTWLALLVSLSSPALVVVVCVGLAVLGLVLLRRSAALYGPQLRWWAGLYPLYVLAATRPTSSIVRYAMFAIVPWWPFPEVDRQSFSRRAQVGLVLMVGAVGIFTQYWWLRWFFILSQHGPFFP